jgi:hypothetical protein
MLMSPTIVPDHCRFSSGRLKHQKPFNFLHCQTSSHRKPSVIIYAISRIKKRESQGWRYTSMVDCLSSMHRPWGDPQHHEKRGRIKDGVHITTGQRLKMGIG